MPALLSHDEPPAYRLECEHGRSPFFLICDHAGNRIPRSLGNLGLDSADLQRHIAWDIGAAAVTCELSAALDATAVLQTYSRLVIDCNRPIGNPSSIVEVSERTAIPGNQRLDPAAAERRAGEIFRPYHARIESLLEARASRGQSTILVSMHSFTPVFMEQPRAWHVGVLYHRDRRLGYALLETLRADTALVVGDNEPYAVSDSTDYAIPVYGERCGLLHVEVEIRQDLIAEPPGQQEWAERMRCALTRAADRIA